MGSDGGIRTTVRWVAAALVGATLLVPGSSSADGPVVRSAGDRESQPFWTDGRMREAPPLAPKRARRADAFRIPFHSGAVPQPSAVPFRTVGKLYLTLRGVRRWCSATVVPSASHSVVLTAAHCLYDGRRWSRRLLFVPAFPDGRRRFGAWRSRSAVVPQPWHRTRNRNFDYGAVRLRRSAGRSVGDVVGEQSLALNQPRRLVFHAVGYPESQRHGDGMWVCSSHYGYSVPDLGPGPPPSAIGCDMDLGASGGPWLIQDAAGSVFVNSVTSFSMDDRPKTVFGPYFTDRVLATIRTANDR